DLIVAGVSDYLVKPLNNDLLRRSIEIAGGVVGKASASKTGKLIQFISSVGGAGATTAVSNIGWILSNRHFKRTLVMDSDFMYGTANLMLDVKVEGSYLDILESPDKIDDYFVETIMKKCGSRFYYLGGLVDLFRGVEADVPAFEALVTLVKRQFNYLLVDSQRDLSPINKIYMEKADCFVIVIEMSVASASNAVRLIEYLNTGYPEKRIIIMANKIGLSAGGALTRELFEKVIERKIDYSMPFEENVALAAANIGQPLAISPGPISNVLENIANDILGKQESKNVEQAILEKEGWTAERIKNLTFEILNKIIDRLK
ncbi:MAG: AAA family ATPase, partial [Holosporaceae bacterium]|nr:AAA family ATPase [Holosporaceae bacterium]